MTKPPSWKPNLDSNWQPNWQANWKVPAPSWKHWEDKPILPTWKPNWNPTMKPTWKPNIQSMGYEPRAPYTDATIPPIPLIEPARKLEYKPKYYLPYASRPFAKVK